MTVHPDKPNLDKQVVADFGAEWQRFHHHDVNIDELKRMYDGYFHIFPWHNLPENAVGFDLGCGSGRWAKFVAPRVTTLHCNDPSSAALDVAKNNLRQSTQCQFHCASVDDIPLEDNAMDFAYCLGVLHHVPDTQAGINACVAKLKPGAPF